FVPRCRPKRKMRSPDAIDRIEPFPHKALTSIPGIDLHPREVQDEDISTFTRLGPGDMLFIDSSHMLRIGADVPFLYLQVPPVNPPCDHTHPRCSLSEQFPLSHRVLDFWPDVADIVERGDVAASLSGL